MNFFDSCSTIKNNKNNFIRRTNLTAPTLTEITPIIEMAKKAAIDYYRLTGKPLGITGEIGEYYAAKYLDLELADARTPGYDAIGPNNKLIQVKSLAVSETKKNKGRVGTIRLEHEWDTVVLVLMNQFFEPRAIYEAERDAITLALKALGSKARNERGSLAISQFISIGKQIWKHNE